MNTKKIYGEAAMKLMGCAFQKTFYEVKARGTYSIDTHSKAYYERLAALGLMSYEIHKLMNFGNVYTNMFDKEMPMDDVIQYMISQQNKDWYQNWVSDDLMQHIPLSIIKDNVTSECRSIDTTLKMNLMDVSDTSSPPSQPTLNVPATSPITVTNASTGQTPNIVSLTLFYMACFFAVGFFVVVIGVIIFNMIPNPFTPDSMSR